MRECYFYKYFEYINKTNIFSSKLKNVEMKKSRIPSSIDIFS